jgi:hypothetical protein
MIYTIAGYTLFICGCIALCVAAYRGHLGGDR